MFSPWRGQADVCRRPPLSTHAFWVERFLVIEQVVQNAIGPVGGVESSTHIAHAPAPGALFGATDARDVAGGMQADQVQGIAQTGMPLARDMADAPEIAAFFGDQVEAGEAPYLGGADETLGMAEVGQVADGQQGTDARHGR